MKSTIENGDVGLAVVLLLNSVVSAYYYLKVLVYMYFREPVPGAPQAIPMRSGYVYAGLILSGILVVLLGLCPGNSFEMATKAVLALR